MRIKPAQKDMSMSVHLKRYGAILIAAEILVTNVLRGFKTGGGRRTKIFVGHHVGYSPYSTFRI